MKKILTVLLALMMLTSLAVFPTAAEGEDPLSGDMTIIGYQVSAAPTSSDANDNYYALRLVAAHANISGYSRFGYNVTVKYTAAGTEQTKTLSEPIMSGTVYQELNANNGDKIDLSSYDAEYFSAVEIIDIPMSAGDLTVTVTPIVEYDGARGRVSGTPVTFTHDFTTLTTMTFNIHNWNTSDAHLERIKLAIKDSYPDVIGFQEMSNDSTKLWVDKLMADADIGATYASFGEPCGDFTGEQCAIFYNKSEFDLVEEKSGTRWLWCEHGVTCNVDGCTGSETAGNFPSASDTTYYRIMTYATLRCKGDGSKVFTFINTHLDLSYYADDEYGYFTVQNKQIDYILSFAQSFINQGIPVILVGDFNPEEGSDVLNDIDDAGFKRAETESVKAEGSEDYDYLKSKGHYTDEHGTEKYPISGYDHIFIHAQSCYFLKYTFCEQVYEVNGVSEYPSDHIPRIAEYALY